MDAAAKDFYDSLEKRRLKRAKREETVRIEEWASDGLCVAHDTGGKLILVRFVIPGELVRVNIYKESEQYGIAEPLEIIESSDKRIVPKCPYFSLCGGCDFQMYSYEDQIELKQEFVKKTFQRLAGMDIIFTGILASPHPFHYRNTMTFKVDPRNKKIGFFRRDTKFIVDIERCLISMEGINKALATARNQAEFPSYNFKVRTTLDGDTVAHWIPIEGFDDREVYEEVTAAGTCIKYKISKDSFFQVNDFLIPTWLETILSFLDQEREERVLDLYCGIGLITLFSAKKGNDTIGVEVARSSIRDARYNAEINELDDNLEFVRGAVEDKLPDLGSPNVIIVDPPRKGLDTTTLGMMLTISPTKIIYSSCKPATMARDIKVLSQDYELEQVFLVDMFPQTHHIELLALLHRKAD